MTTELVFEPGAFGVRAALLRDGRLIELHDSEDAEEVTDRLFLARVTRIEPRLNAAFLDYGEGRDGYLAAKDARFAAGVAERRPIAKLLREGELVVVQGLREADEDKGPRFTTDLRLFGLFVIYRPHGGTPEVSARARGRDRERLVARARALFPAGGVVLRRFAARVGDEPLLAEARALEARWRRIEEEARRRGRPGRLATGEDPLETLWRRLFEHEPERVRVADAALHARLRRLIEALPPALRPRLLETEGESAFEETGVAAELETALSRVVPLAGGGRLVIEPTLACTAVDVDGEGRDALALDLEAATELARQLRLRNVGGTIIVDFVDLARPQERKRLEEALRRAFRDDPLNVQIQPMSPLGIVQISRARRGRPLAARWRRPCRLCAGSGQEESLEARAEALFAALRGRRVPPRGLGLAPDLRRFLEARQPLAWLSGIRLEEDPTLPAGGFRIREDDG